MFKLEFVSEVHEEVAGSKEKLPKINLGLSREPKRHSPPLNWFGLAPNLFVHMVEIGNMFFITRAEVHLVIVIPAPLVEIEGPFFYQNLPKVTSSPSNTIPFICRYLSFTCKTSTPLLAKWFIKLAFLKSL